MTDHTRRRKKPTKPPQHPINQISQFYVKLCIAFGNVDIGHFAEGISKTFVVYIALRKMLVDAETYMRAANRRVLNPKTGRFMNQTEDPDFLQDLRSYIPVCCAYDTIEKKHYGLVKCVLSCKRIQKIIDESLNDTKIHGMEYFIELQDMHNILIDVMGLKY